MRKTLLILAFVLLPVTALAQTVTVNPSAVQFVASDDHDAVALDGSALVSRYDLRVYLQATGITGTPLKTVNLGKPTPVSGSIVVTDSALFAGLAQNVVYVATVAAIGPDGAAESTPSNPFGFQTAGARIPRPPSLVVVKK